MFSEELDDEQIVEIIDKLSLSDILALDTAYSAGNKEAVQNILGPLPQLEYNMGGGRQATSNAASRPTTSGAVKKADAQAAPASDEAPSTYSRGSQPAATPSKYSGGNQNVAPVVAAPNEPEEEELEEEVDEAEEYTDWVLCNNDSPTEEVTETNIVEMQAWLKRRAGIVT
jgi:hypothetical protein